ncbi:MAG TPA: PilZ domain-containing protein [Thermodesulfovibrionales bacterium]|nr:PilZ domain-containing protein [Thermodesulfovibrionales bacterium]
MKPLNPDKRRQERVKKRCAIEFVVDGKTHIGITGDFSLSGIFIRTPNHFAPGTILDMSLQLPDGSVSKIKGTVARILKSSDDRKSLREEGIGIEITEEDPHYRHFCLSLLAIPDS